MRRRRNPVYVAPATTDSSKWYSYRWIAGFITTAIFYTISHNRNCDTEMVFRSAPLFETTVKFIPLGDRRFQLVEFDQSDTRPKGTVPENATVIPILVLSGNHPVQDSQGHLFKKLDAKTQNTSLVFRWYTVFFKQYSAYYSGRFFESQVDFMQMLFTLFRSPEMFAGRKPIIIAESSAALVAIKSALEQWESLVYGLGTDLIILESASTNIHEYPDFLFKKMYMEMQEEWNGQADNSNTGVLSFYGGANDFWTRSSSSAILKGAKIVPVWSIDGVPEDGLSESRMLICDAFLDHLSDFLIYYGNRMSYQTSKSIIDSFYSEFENEKRKKTSSKNLKRFSIKGGDEEATSIIVAGSCLRAATLFRGNFTRRMEKKYETDIISFKIMEIKKYEDIKILTESDSDCHLSINQYFPDWFMDFRLFRDSIYSHYFYVGAIIAGTFMILLESGKRSSREEHYFWCHILFFGAVLYHIYYRHSIFLYPRGGLIMGCGSVLSGYSITNLIDQKVRSQFRYSYDARRHYLGQFIHISRIKLIWCLLIVWIVSQPICLFFTFVLLISSTRPILVYPMWATFHSIWLQSDPRNVVSGFFDIGHGLYRITPETLYWCIPHFHILTLTFFIIICFIRRQEQNNTKFKFSRSLVNQISIPTLIVQFLMAPAPLELHYSVAIIILTMNLYSKRLVPPSLFKLVADYNLIDVEGEYSQMESSSD